METDFKKKQASKDMQSFPNAQWKLLQFVTYGTQLMVNLIKERLPGHFFKVTT
jgi:hypothetical protein